MVNEMRVITITPAPKMPNLVSNTFQTQYAIT